MKRFSKNLFLVLLITSLLILFVGSWASMVIARQTNYYNEKYGFSIEPPNGWTIDESGLLGTAVIFYGPREENFTVNVNILVEDAPGVTLDEYVLRGKSTLPQILTNYQLVSEGRREISGLGAYELVLTHTQGVFDLKAKQVALLKDDKAYVITFTALRGNFARYLPDFETSIETFKFVPKPINWLLIGGIIVVVLAIIGAVAVFKRRKTVISAILIFLHGATRLRY